MNKFFASFVSVVILSACGDNAVNAVLPAPEAMVRPPVAAPVENANRPKGDASKSLDQYEVIDGGSVLFALTQTSRPSGPNLQEMAMALSRAYRQETDGFKRQDILKAVQPEIEVLLLKAKNQRYLAMDVPASYQVETYDFDSKTFGLQIFSEGFSSHYFHDHPSATVAFFNKSEFRRMHVDDETAARRIESMRQRNGMVLRIYFFVSGYNSLKSTLDAQIMAVALLGQDAKALAVQKGR